MKWKNCVMIINILHLVDHTPKGPMVIPAASLLLVLNPLLQAAVTSQCIYGRTAWGLSFMWEAPAVPTYATPAYALLHFALMNVRFIYKFSHVYVRASSIVLWIYLVFSNKLFHNSLHIYCILWLWLGYEWSCIICLQ